MVRSSFSRECRGKNERSELDDSSKHKFSVIRRKCTQSWRHRQEVQRTSGPGTIVLTTQAMIIPNSQPGSWLRRRAQAQLLRSNCVYVVLSGLCRTVAPSRTFVQRPLYHPVVFILPSFHCAQPILSLQLPDVCPSGKVVRLAYSCLINGVFFDTRPFALSSSPSYLLSRQKILPLYVAPPLSQILLSYTQDS